ncbi:bifunctional UDP-3-O-[3-hydroxymyristoyl] N-acetylglucosamine deacetylase/3-hydroxyacyl-ACP dehydratase [Chryseobacterium shandongense]|jgi:UDP-3-O-[3-hydroxymyristoyl] N-acetylglucosamine deacetylase/3-hydroxyacyl-[acyl-carrier-protein] dehydratase|uniref:Multifunctional fusion protein n=1 Tax=Chryseobacterium shandongense TaxID=1493872 RepID=A0A3G6QVJ6_9FLAO|nr:MULTISPECIES: bifunctional UDP-3-O-[3-hydroxymyristoyl] N-acetylglucosamine deacetylase/3-hydroxyacyl-ACP dehydratase [Chryseobacterium]AZA59480.1 bifunctional UDP-3-O-[3-hydroxymyristoyl] N-acetylglucosamine deacetylase/3-hydroxyacyl-ACP dehydratase [Chryseobacterium shandongense]AZA86685.1 bifunctional UDP-3-O-[3-hydroxymyristoyl] N-acetylglucosamine deacetylase/3-hydroxyacyl-ACP dehydratase [Chryseobacterium shandongense]AZA95098.1 bifunctional UDP-3-O-[3-hydroxymyristoyl] N-acetylglucosam
MSDMQKTLQQEVTLSGIGLHTGKEVKLTMKPAKENTGFVFVRTDLEGHPQVEADVNYVVATERGTTLEKLGVKITTCEHLLAALVGCDIDNAILEMDASEPPILDGSSKYFVEAIESVGVVEQNVAREYLVVKEVLTYSDPATGSEITIIPSDTYEVTTMVDFGTKVLGTQNATLKNISEFKDEISSARTFSFLHELEMLLDHGLIKGGDISNAIVYVDKDLTPETTEKLKKAFGKDNVSIRPNGILDNLNLNYPNEAARHKLLDVIGDLALAGVKIKGKVIANKPGHYVNTQFAKKLNRQWKLQKKKNVPDFDLTKEPVFDINGIMKLMPHRPPFLLIDKILELSDSHVVGLKNVTMNEPFFVGHFPKEPVMPGVLQVEALAQTGGILVLASVPDPENYSTYFIKIDKVKFKRKVVPGDTIIFKIELIEPIRRGIVHMQGYGYVGDAIAVEAELMAQVAKNKVD